MHWRWRPGSRKAATPAKSGDQDAEAGDVFVKITEKTQFPGFGFSWRVESGTWQRQKKAPGEKKCAGEQDLGICDMLA